jgi:hypothetical protein
MGEYSVNAGYGPIHVIEFKGFNRTIHYYLGAHFDFLGNIYVTRR